MSKKTRKRSARKTSDTENSVTRSALLDATEQLLRYDGYAAVSARSVAQRAGLKNHQLIYYYFRTHEDLLRAVFRRRAEQNIEALKRVVKAANILRSLWEHNCNPDESWFAMEFMAIANHYESIREDIASYGAKFRELEMAAVSRHFAARGQRPLAHPAVISLLISSLSRVMAREATLGLLVGHDEVESFVEDYLRDSKDLRPSTSLPKRRRKRVSTP